MQLLVVRHAIAQDREKWKGDDDKRPLTDEGRGKMKKGARGVARLVKAIDLLASSPLVRARQSAEILADAYGGLAVKVVAALAPGQQPAALGRWLETEARGETVAIVGHEPGLSTAVSWLLTGAERPLIELKKGAACLLDLARGAQAGGATLLWALTPGQLRDLGAS